MEAHGRRGPKPRKVTNRVCLAFRQLREALGETQQSLAYRLNTAIRTIARWETTQPPSGKTLVQLEALARKAGKAEIADVFREALRKELGLRELVYPPPPHPQPRNDEEQLVADAALMVMQSYSDQWKDQLWSFLDRTIGLDTVRFFQEQSEKRRALWPDFLRLLAAGKSKAEACRELGIPENLFKVTEAKP